MSAIEIPALQNIDNSTDEILADLLDLIALYDHSLGDWREKLQPLAPFSI